MTIRSDIKELREHIALVEEKRPFDSQPSYLELRLLDIVEKLNRKVERMARRRGALR